jgi:hypothetical protein
MPFLIAGIVLYGWMMPLIGCDGHLYVVIYIVGAIIR